MIMASITGSEYRTIRHHRHRSRAHHPIYRATPHPWANMNIPHSFTHCRNSFRSFIPPTIHSLIALLFNKGAPLNPVARMLHMWNSRSELKHNGGSKLLYKIIFYSRTFIYREVAHCDCRINRNACYISLAENYSTSCTTGEILTHQYLWQLQVLWKPLPQPKATAQEVHNQKKLPCRTLKFN